MINFCPLSPTSVATTAIALYLLIYKTIVIKTMRPNQALKAVIKNTTATIMSTIVGRIENKI